MYVCMHICGVFVWVDKCVCCVPLGCRPPPVVLAFLSIFHLCVGEVLSGAAVEAYFCHSHIKVDPVPSSAAAPLAPTHTALLPT